LSKQEKFSDKKLAPVLLYTRSSSKPAKEDIFYRIGTDVIYDFKTQLGREFEEKLMELISEIFNPDVPFSPTDDIEKTCRNCDFSQLCGRN
jgi:hypothetical protein